MILGKWIYPNKNRERKRAAQAYRAHALYANTDR